MARKIPLTILFFTLTSIAFAQSGRNKPPETPTTTPRPRVVYLPTLETNSPLPNRKSRRRRSREDGDDIIRVESALVPIPVSVIDSGGKAITNLRLEDFELSVNGKAAEISDLFRSETPVRLAMLFDNSSSVIIAREFEKEAATRFFKRVCVPKKIWRRCFPSRPERGSNSR
jgi:hypothetical protein